MQAVEITKEIFLISYFSLSDEGGDNEIYQFLDWGRGVYHLINLNFPSSAAIISIWDFRVLWTITSSLKGFIQLGNVLCEYLYITSNIIAFQLYSVKKL